MRRCGVGLVVVGCLGAGCGLDTGGDGIGSRTRGHFSYADEVLADEAHDRMADVLQQRLVNIGIDDAEVDIDGTGVTIVVGDHGSTIDDAFAAIERRGVFELRPVLAGGTEGTAEIDEPSVVLLEPGDTLPPTTTPTTLDTDAYTLGPAPGSSGDLVAVAGTDVSPVGEWGVVLTLSDEGDAVLDELATACFERTEVCPTGRLAMVIDEIVISAPTIQQPSFERDQVQISGGLDEQSARQLALILQSGALPVALQLESTTTDQAPDG